jgi:hypothetical protein
MSEDDDPEIERLRAVRAAFRAMPDEEPPERGLAELMAAARAKADEMKPAPATTEPRVRAVSWWQRIVATLRRPPVLAMVSVLVLVGGAVLIGRRGDDEVARPSAPKSPPATAMGGAAPAGASAGSSAIASPVDVGDNQDRKRLDEGKDTAAHAQPSAKPEPPKPEPPNPAPPKPAIDEVMKPAEPAPPSVAHHATRPPSRVAPPPPPEDKNKEPTADPKSTREVETKPKQDQDVRQDQLVQGEVLPAPATQSPADAARNAPRKPTSDQLLAQCRAAAGRGDCAAVKAIAARIEKDDTAFYRERVAKDAAITRCLAK